MILYENTYERPGNDAWLKDTVILHKNSIGLYIEHKVDWRGWGDDILEHHRLELDESDVEGSQKKIDEYIYEHSLHDVFPNGEDDGIKIHLKILLDDLK